MAQNLVAVLGREERQAHRDGERGLKIHREGRGDPAVEAMARRRLKALAVEQPRLRIERRPSHARGPGGAGGPAASGTGGDRRPTIPATGRAPRGWRSATGSSSVGARGWPRSRPPSPGPPSCHGWPGAGPPIPLRSAGSARAPGGPGGGSRPRSHRATSSAAGRRRTPAAMASCPSKRSTHSSLPRSSLSSRL